MTHWLSQIGWRSGRIIHPATRGIAWTGAAVVFGMMLLTSVDVILRYVFNRPILGIYEITELMMIVVIFSALAYTAVEKGHIKIDIVVPRLSQKAQAVVNSIVCLFSLGVIGLIAWRSYLQAWVERAAGDESIVLGMPTYPLLLAVAFGSALLGLVLFVNLVEHLAEALERSRWQVLVGLTFGIALILLVFSFPIWGRLPSWEISRPMIGFIGLCLMLVLLSTGMWIGVAMGLVGFLGVAYLSGIDPALTMMGKTPFVKSLSYALSIIPMFILMGTFVFHSGLGDDLYATVYKWLGQLPGGMAMATVGACACFASITGSSAATVATIGRISLPEMRKYKYDTALATGSIAAGGTMGILIPPSTVLIIYAILTERSVGHLFAAGVIPGVLEAIFYMITIFIIIKCNPMAGPSGPRTSFKTKLFSLKGTWGVFALFVLVMGGIFFGVFTPNEGAGIGALGALIFVLGRRKLTRQVLASSTIDAVKMTAMVFLIFIGAMIFSYFLALSRLPFDIANIVAGLEMNRYIILAAIILIYAVLGCVMTALSMVFLTVPIFYPVILALGFDPIWFGIIIVRVVEIALITPPVGGNVFMIKTIFPDIPIGTIFKGIIPFLISDFFHVALLVAVPQIVLFLPSLMK